MIFLQLVLENVEEVPKIVTMFAYCHVTLVKAAYLSCQIDSCLNSNWRFLVSDKFTNYFAGSLKIIFVSWCNYLYIYESITICDTVKLRCD